MKQVAAVCPTFFQGLWLCLTDRTHWKVSDAGSKGTLSTTVGRLRSLLEELLVAWTDRQTDNSMVGAVKKQSRAHVVEVTLALQIFKHRLLGSVSLCTGSLILRQEAGKGVGSQTCDHCL